MRSVNVSGKSESPAMAVSNMSPLIKKKKFQSEWFWAYIFIAPIVLGVFIFEICPIIFSFGMGFTQWNGMSKAVFVGVNNFISLSKDPQMRHEIINTGIYTIVSVPVTLFLSMGVANLLNQGLKGTGVFRVIYFLPNVTMPVAIALVWKWLFNSKVGLIDLLLRTLHLPAPMWVADPKYILWAMIIVSVWGGIGYNAIIMLAGLQGIPPSLYEAADIDGASPGIKFWRITVPLLTPTLFFLMTMSFIGAFQIFDIVYIFAGGASTAGGPLMDASRTIVYGVYEKAFNFLQMGLASAECIILFAVIFIITLVQFRLQDKWVYYE
jgi:multiple sugar transport system permease protein